MSYLKNNINYLKEIVNKRLVALWDRTKLTHRYHDKKTQKRGYFWSPVKCTPPWLNPLRCSSKLNEAGSSSASIAQGKLKRPFLGSKLLFNIDFTPTLIGRLLKAMQADKRSFVTLNDYFNGCRDSKVFILRHDVDKRPMHSLKMAQLETELGIAGTYYFRIKPCSIDENVIKKISAMGHEIGYHYENLTDTNGDYESAIKDFESGLERLRKLYPVKTICMHGSPLSKYDNKKIWEKYDYRDYGIIADPSFDIDYNEVFYITDTGRAWNNSSVSIRDKVVRTEAMEFGIGNAECGKLKQRSEDGKGEKVRRSEKQKIGKAEDGKGEKVRRSEKQKIGKTEDGKGEKIRRSENQKIGKAKGRDQRTEVRGRNKNDEGRGTREDGRKAEDGGQRTERARRLEDQKSRR